MNPNIEKLYAIAGKKERLIIGLMSGTSFDGLDIALCKIKGNGETTQLELLEFETITYENDFKEELKSVFAKKEGGLEKVCLLNASIGKLHASLINASLKKWKISGKQVDLVASHGQTVYHSPAFSRNDKYPDATLQIGDGDHISVATGIITISDFRQKHIAAGGEGAPLAVYGDYLIFSKKGENRIMLNIGGIANFTFLPADNDLSKVFCSDTGPGNTIMDAFIQKNFPGKYFDENSVIAKKGMVNKKLLSQLKDHPFFKKGFPKTTGPELFNLEYLTTAQNKSGTDSLSQADILATLNRFSADMIVLAIRQSITEKEKYRIYLSGGGMHNPLLVENLRTQLPDIQFFTTNDLFINPDAKEAVLFALLANECICGDPSKNKTPARNRVPAITMGKISFPS